MLAFTLLAYWTVTDFWDVGWFAGEDGVSEWWSVGTYLAAAGMAALAAVSLGRMGYRRFEIVYALLAVGFILGALEEISWGQRLFGWGTPEALTRLNEQNETTIHNLSGVDWVFPTLLFWGSVVALIGAGVRAVWHHYRRVTTADFLLPSLVLSPALLMIIFWIGATQPIPGNLPRMLLLHFDLRPVGSEVPEVLAGLCVLLYTHANLRKVLTLRQYKSRNL